MADKKSLDNLPIVIAKVENNTIPIDAAKFGYPLVDENGNKIEIAPIPTMSFAELLESEQIIGSGNKYYVKDYSVYCGSCEVARVYVGHKSDEIRILQGMPRMKVINKIIGVLLYEQDKRQHRAGQNAYCPGCG